MGEPKFVFNIAQGTLSNCFSPAAQEQIASLVNLVNEAPERPDKAALMTDLTEAEGAITGWGALPFDAELLDAAAKLKVVMHGAGSLRGVATDEFWKRGVRITSAAHINAIPVAEFNVGMILMTLKRVFRYQHEFKELDRGGWRREGVPAYYRTTVGIIGMGHIGRHLLKLLQPYDLNILITSRYFPDDEAARMKAKKVPLDVLLRESDALTLLTSNIGRNQKMLGKEQFAMMKDGAVFINTGRGALIDEAALIEELKTGRLVACLDVTDPEPPVEGSLLYSLPNCILTPHVAGSIGPECYRFGDQVVRELRHYVADEPFENEVTEEEFRYLA